MLGVCWLVNDCIDAMNSQLKSNRFLALAIVCVLFASIALSTAAQQTNPNNLPLCPEVPNLREQAWRGHINNWTNCFGKIYNFSPYFLYQGEFQHGRPNGFGRSEKKDSNETFLGQYQNGQYHGQGIQILEGKRREGIWQNGSYLTAGKLNLPSLNVNINVNTNHADIESKQRQLANPNKLPLCPENANLGGESRQGYIKDWHNCFGTVNDFASFGSPSIFVGEFQFGRPNGLGRSEKNDRNEIFLGQYQNGQYHGQGIQILEGKRREGIWSSGSFLIPGQVNFQNRINNIANNTEHSGIENESKHLAEQPSTSEDKRRGREKKGDHERVKLNVTHTQPARDGSVSITVQTNTDTISLQVNGEEQGGSADGNYAIKKFARIGQDNQFTIVAVDINGNSDTKTITVSRQAPAAPQSATLALKPENIKQQPSKDAVAIVIGIADYKNLPRADYANDDARVFYDYAIRALGVKPENIKLLVDTDADEVGIYRAFKTWLPSRVRSTTDVYVYYSGHGLPTADGRGLYVLPQRADRDFIDKTAITQAEINAAIQAAKPKSVTIFLDACYSGQARTGETLLASARPVSLRAATSVFPDTFTVITASAADQISSSSPELKHGIFSYFLMRGMEGDADINRDGKITAGEMQAYLSENVSRQAGMMNRKQEPQLIGDAGRVLVGK
jgi:hypothetical protein